MQTIGPRDPTPTKPSADGPVLLLHELETSDLRNVDRLVYMESIWALHEREQLLSRTQALGFRNWQGLKMHTADGSTVLTEWQIMVFTR